MPARPLEEEVIIGPNNYVNLVNQAKQQELEISLISQIQSARLKDEKKPAPKRKGLTDMWFWAGDGVGYGMQEDDVVFYHTDAANNPGFENPAEFKRQVTGRDNAFFLDPKKSGDLEAKANDSNDNSVHAINISKYAREGLLKPYEHSTEFVYVEVSTEALVQGKREFRKRYGDKITKLFDMAHGKEAYGKRGIGAKLQQKGKSNTRIYFLNPDYVKGKLLDKEKGTTLWRASCVSGFDYHSIVDFSGRDLGDGDRHLRGVVRESGEAGTAEKGLPVMPYETAQKELQKLVQPTSPLFKPIKDFVDRIYQAK